MKESGGELDPGVRANLRLTALVGLAMIVPLLVVTLSGLSFDQLWRVHYFAGFLLVPLLVLKLCSTGYRMVAYYLGNRRYRRAGPPAPLLRVLAPLLVVSTVVLFVSGIVMWLEHSRLQPWSTLHTDSAVVFSITASIHLLAYLRRASSESAAELRRRTRSGVRLRGALGATLLVGVVLAVATIAPSQLPARTHHVRDEFGRITAPQGG
jgi:amino acid transporter